MTCLRNIKLTIEYDGSAFQGWQIQKSHQRTVQGEFEKIFPKIFHENIRLIGSGRTDRGVHALGQVANFTTASRLSVKNIQNALNAHLPADIAVVKVVEVSPDFHAQYSVQSKIYRYSIFTRQISSPFVKKMCWHYPYPLNIPLLRAEANHLIGRKDFKSFCSHDPAQTTQNNKNTVRHIYAIKVTCKKDFLHIDIKADGFLYKMVRGIVGTLIEIAAKNLPKGTIQRILRAKDRRKAGPTAPPQGLCLLKVSYSPKRIVDI